MKKIFSIALAATLLAAGCQKTEVIGTSTTGSKMTFSTEMKKITKAGELPTGPKANAIGDTNLHEQGFQVWAYADFDISNVENVDKTPSSNTYLIYDGMAGMQLKYNKETQRWNTPDNKEYYWPGTDKELKFFAVSSNQVMTTTGTDAKLAIDHGIGNNTDGPKITITDFQLGNNKADEDLMVADFRKQHQGQNERVVKLNFHHTLSKVEFKFRTSKINDVLPNVFVQNILVEDLYNKGTLEVTPKEDDEENGNVSTYATDANDNATVTPVDLDWTKLAGEADFSYTWHSETTDENFPSAEEIEYAETGTQYSKNALKLTESAEEFVTWLMIPNISETTPNYLADKYVTITYVINKRQFKAKFSLAGQKTVNGENTTYQLPNWDINQYITYTITLAPNLITFNASSTDWSKFDGDGDENKDSNGDKINNNDDINMNN